MKETFTYYTLFTFLGLAASLAVYLWLGKRRGAWRLQQVFMFIFAVIGVLIGAHVFFFISRLPWWLDETAGKINSFPDLLNEIANASSGLVYYGGLFGAALAVLIICKTRHLDLRAELNNAAVTFPLFHFFGRIGCALTGCCYGIEYHGIFAVTYSPLQAVSGKSDDLADFSRFPVQALEALLELIIFFAVLFIYLKTKDKYSVFAIYLGLYAVVRFFDEFLRGDAYRGIWGPLSFSQWISLIALAAVLICFLKKFKTRTAESCAHNSSYVKHN